LSTPTAEQHLADNPELADPTPYQKTNARQVTGATLLVLLFLLVLLIMGIWDRFNLGKQVTTLFTTEEDIRLLAADTNTHPDSVMLLVQRDGQSLIRRIDAWTRAPDYMSDPEHYALNPVPNPDGYQVAYVAITDGEPAIYVGGPNETITPTVNAETLKVINHTKYQVCDTHVLAWSTDGEYLATFICNAEENVSKLLITQVGQDNEILNKTQGQANYPRAVTWITPHVLVYTDRHITSDILYRLDMNTPDKPEKIYSNP
jgi:hypothetical protein